MLERVQSRALLNSMSLALKGSWLMSTGPPIGMMPVFSAWRWMESTIFWSTSGRMLAPSFGDTVMRG